MTFNVKSSFYGLEKGYLLLTILGILVVVIFSSTHVGKLLFENYKNLNLKSSGDFSYDIALGTLEAVEKQFSTNPNQPKVYLSTDGGVNGYASVFAGEVWGTGFADYKLVLGQDPISSKQLSWWQQPQSWWAQYAHELDANELSSTLLETGKGYSIVEYIGPYIFNEDLTLVSRTGGNITSHVYRITAAGFSNDGSRAVLSTTLVKTYVF